MARAPSSPDPPGFTALPPDSFELLASPPSPHGWRLQQTIGLGAVKAEVESLDSANGRITSARAGDRTFRADAFVIATGHHIGGGIRGGRTAVEALLGMGVFNDRWPVSSVRARPTPLEFLDAAAAVRSGLMTDKRPQRPYEGRRLLYPKPLAIPC